MQGQDPLLLGDYLARGRSESMRSLATASLFALILGGFSPCVAAGGEVKQKPAEVTKEGVEFFEKKIRPVLVEQCYKCHSANARKIKGGLFLDSAAGMVKGGGAGPAPR